MAQQYVIYFNAEGDFWVATRALKQRCHTTRMLCRKSRGRNQRPRYITEDEIRYEFEKNQGIHHPRMIRTTKTNKGALYS